MSARASLLARFLAAHLVLFGAAAMSAAWAEDAAPVANHTDAEAAPIDTSITPQGPSHFRHELKARDAKKYTIAHPSGNSRAPPNLDARQQGWRCDEMRSGSPSIGASADIKGTEVKAPRTDPRRWHAEKCKPCRKRRKGSGWGRSSPPRVCSAPGRRDHVARPTNQHGDEPFNYQRSRSDPSGIGRRRHWRSGEERRGCHQRN